MTSRAGIWFIGLPTAKWQLEEFHTDKLLYGGTADYTMEMAAMLMRVLELAAAEMEKMSAGYIPAPC